jgi:hypothetical protein
MAIATLPLSGGGKIIRRQRDEDEAVGVGGDVIEMERAFSLLGAALAKREKAAEFAVSCAIGRIGKQARRIVEIKTRADNEFDAIDLACRKMGAHHACERIAVGDGNGLKAKRLCRRHQLLRMRAAAQEGEIGGDV